MASQHRTVLKTSVSAGSAAHALTSLRETHASASRPQAVGTPGLGLAGLPTRPASPAASGDHEPPQRASATPLTFLNLIEIIRILWTCRLMPLGLAGLARTPSNHPHPRQGRSASWRPSRGIQDAAPRGPPAPAPRLVSAVHSHLRLLEPSGSEGWRHAGRSPRPWVASPWPEGGPPAPSSPPPPIPG